MSFGQVSAGRAADTCHWVDAEVHEKLLIRLDIEIESLPMLMILDGDEEVCFAGPIAPSAEFALRLCRAAEEGGLRADLRDAFASRASGFVSALAGN